MKYKNIKAMSHNFAHSFLSYDCDLEEDLLEDVRSKKPDDKLIIQFIPHDTQKDAIFNERVQKSISDYREHFSKHCACHDVDLDAIKLLQIQIVKNASHQILSYVLTVDDKGKKYKQYVSF